MSQSITKATYSVWAACSIRCVRVDALSERRPRWRFFVEFVMRYPLRLKNSIRKFPDWLIEIIGKLMSKKREDRCQSANEVAELLSKRLAEIQESRPQKSDDLAVPHSRSPHFLESSAAIDSTTEAVSIRRLSDSNNGSGSSVRDLIARCWRKQSRIARWTTIVGGIGGIVLAAILLFPSEKATTDVQVHADKVEHRSLVVNSTAKEKVEPKIGWQGWPINSPKPAIAPYDAQQARKYQQAWAEFLNLPVEYTNSIGMRFRLIPPGEFLMGTAPGRDRKGSQEVSAERHLLADVSYE